MPPTARTLLSKHLILHLHRLGRCRGKLWNLASWRIVQSISILQKLISSVQSRCKDNCLLHKKAFHFSKANTSNYPDTVKWTNEQKRPRMNIRKVYTIHRLTSSADVFPRPA